MLSQCLRIVTVTRRLKPSNRNPIFWHIQGLRKLAWRQMSSQRNDFELHWLLIKTTGNILIIPLRWIEAHVIFLACLFSVALLYLDILWLSSWHNFGHLPAILAKQFRTPLEKEPEHHHFFGIFYTPFWNATKHERFREAATFLCSKRQLSVTNFGNQSGRQSWEIKSCFNLRSCNQVEMPKQKVVDLGNLRINNINITVFSIFHFLFWSMLKYETIMNYHGKSIQLAVVSLCFIPSRCIWPSLLLHSSVVSTVLRCHRLIQVLGNGGGSWRVPGFNIAPNGMFVDVMLIHMPPSPKTWNDNGKPTIFNRRYIFPNCISPLSCCFFFGGIVVVSYLIPLKHQPYVSWHWRTLSISRLLPKRLVFLREFVLGSEPSINHQSHKAVMLWAVPPTEA